MAKRRKYTSITDVPRNDLDAARAIYKASRPIGTDVVEMLTMLQDDPTDLLAMIAEEAWDVIDPDQEAIAALDALLAPVTDDNREK